MKKFRPAYLLAPFVYLTIAYLSLSHNHYKSPVSFGEIPVDKVVHFTMYFTLTFASLIQICLLGKIKSPKAMFLWACIIPAMYGGLMELLQQYFTTDRTGDWLDFTANCTGVTVAYLLFRALSVRLSWISRDQSPSQVRDRGLR